MNEWELLKENVEPLKEGRKMDSLKAALTQTEKVKDTRDAIRKDFEAALRTYSGDDPLSVYHSYILWLQQNYPEGGHDAKLPTVVQKCIENCFTCEEYLNDTRFLDVFLTFIKQVDDPLEIYTNFYDHGFAHKLANFYINWAWQLESHKFFKRANEVLEMGLRNNARPKVTITEAQTQLQMRLAKAVATGQLDSSDENSDDERRPLNKLKEKKKKSKCDAPVQRVGNAIDKNNDGLKNQKIQNNQTKVKTIIYTDENEEIPQQKQKKKVVQNNNDKRKHVTAVAKENDIKPEPWNINKIPQNVPKPNPLTFEIHADDEFNDDEWHNAYKPPESNMLRVRKRNDESPPLAIFEKPDPLKKYMFNTNKIYAGSEEYSFEEIRGRKWMIAMKRTMEREEERLRSQKLQEEVEQLRQQVALLLSQQSSQQCSKLNSNGQPQNVTSSAESSNTRSANFSVSKGAMSMVRELWNGTLANPEYSEAIDNEKRDEPKAGKFNIYQESMTKGKDTDSEKFDSEDKDGISQFTFVLPKSKDDFVACCASTPVSDHSHRRIITGADLANGNPVVNNFIGGMTAKLSPIVETSREYNSKSSSSSSATRIGRTKLFDSKTDENLKKKKIISRIIHK